MLSAEQIKRVFPQLSDPALLDEIRKYARVRRFEDGEIILDQGMEVPFVPVVIRGIIRVVRQDDEGRELLLYYLLPGDSCAASLSCCMNYNRSEVTAIAEDDVELLGLPPEKVDEWITRFKEWKNLVFSTYRNRFEDLLETVNSVAFTQLDERLWKYLKERSRLSTDGLVHASHQEISQDLNSSREVISRLLKQLERLGKVKLRRNLVELVV